MPPAAPGYHHGSLRNALLAEAAQLVETEGVDALTLRELARRLGVSHAAPAHHFQDKAALLAELAGEGFEELTNELAAARHRGRTPTMQLREAGRAYVRFALRRPGHYRVMFGRGLGTAAGTPRLVDAACRAYDELRQAVAAALPPARARSPEKVRESAFLAWSTTHGAAMLLLDGPGFPDLPPDEREAVVPLMIDHASAAVAAAIAGP